MNKIDDYGLFICRYISDLFEYSTLKKDCSSKNFIKAYVFSSLQKRTENKSFMIDSIDISNAYEEIKKEKKLTRGNDIYPSYVMSWIGYIMKYFSYQTGISERVLYGYIKPEELYRLYEAYHSLDNDLVVKRIIEAKNIRTELNDVELLKKIYMSK